jgi:branched-chain amino acid transport system ATP-binding protein
MPHALEVRGVTVRFGGLAALHNLSVPIPAESITALIGPNGSGKSTLINTVSGQIAQTQGDVLLHGQNISRVRTDRIAAAGLARTYQVPRLPPALSIAEIISVPLLYVRPEGPRPLRFRDPAEVARYVGLDRDLATPCANLTVPELRRLEIARALAAAPTVLLLDEVMAGLPQADTAHAVDLVRRIHAAGVTVVVVEHVMRIIADICSHAVVLNQGGLIAAGAPHAVLSDPVVQEAYLGKGFTL